MRYTCESLQLDGSSSIDDLTLLPSFEDKDLEAGLDAAIRHGVLDAYQYDSETPGMSGVLFTKCEYDMYCGYRGSEPPWISIVGERFANFLRTGPLICEGEGRIMPNLPFLGFGYILQDGGIIEDVAYAANVNRLMGIRQLAFLRDPVVFESGEPAFSVRFNHNRYMHSLDTMAIATLIIANIPEFQEYEKLGRVAALTHDTLTPAGGDTTKSIDPAAFDEDECFPEMFVRPEWKEFRDRYDLDENLLSQVILGKGVLGRMLDLSDKSSYVARDTSIYLSGCHPPLLQHTEEHSVGQASIRAITEEDPHVCALWESVELFCGKLVIGDTDRLVRFLRLRALLFKHLYFNLYSRVSEYVAGLGIIRYMYRKGLITRGGLLTNDDSWLEMKIAEFLGEEFVLFNLFNPSEFRIIEGLTLKEAQRKVLAFNQDPRVIALIDDFPYKARSGTDRFHVRKGGEAVLFKDAFPAVDEEINQILTFSQGVNLYVIPIESFRLGKEGNARLNEIFHYPAT